jgi:hypothetical protein
LKKPRTHCGAFFIPLPYKIFHKKSANCYLFTFFFEDLLSGMKNVILYGLILIGFFLFVAKPASSQEIPAYGKNAFAFELGRAAINELNMSYERFLTSRKTIEFTGGLVFVNDNLEEIFKGWKNGQVFSEHGYTGRFNYKVFRRTEGSTKKWRDYISPGLSYKHLYYNEQWFENDRTDSKDVKYKERFFQKRERNKYSIDFVWGKVYEMNGTFALEFYYGGGVAATDVTRTVLRIQPDDRIPESDGGVYDVNNEVKSFYIRPYPFAGMKLRIRF